MAPRPATRRLHRPSPLAVLACALLACAAALRPLTDEDVIAGARALDTSYRVKDRVTVPGPNGIEYVLPIGEYRPVHADADGILYAAPAGVTERAGFSRHPVPGGIHVANAPGRPFERPSLWAEGPGGRIRKLPLPASALGRYGDALVFAVDGEELLP
jgi:hypothetical protein